MKNNMIISNKEKTLFRLSQCVMSLFIISVFYKSLRPEIFKGCLMVLHDLLVCGSFIYMYVYIKSMKGFMFNRIEALTDILNKRTSIVKRELENCITMQKGTANCVIYLGKILLAFAFLFIMSCLINYLSGSESPYLVLFGLRCYKTCGIITLMYNWWFMLLYKVSITHYKKVMFYIRIDSK